MGSAFSSKPPEIPTGPVDLHAYKNVVIIGGAWTALYIASEVRRNPLPKGYRLIIIDKNSHHHYQFAFPRASIIGGFEKELFIPYTNMFPSPHIGTVVHALVTSITSTTLKLDRVVPEFESDTIPYEYLIYSAGTQQILPVNLGMASTKAEGVEFLKGYQKKVEGATSVLVVGGGAVGLELAAEIKEHYPGKRVTLVHSRERYLLPFSPRLAERAWRILDGYGVRQILGERVVVPEGYREGVMSSVKLGKSGEVVEFDLLIMATGGKPNSAVLSTLSPTVVDESGYVRVKRTLQIEDDRFPHVFASGDVTNTPEVKNGRTAFAHGQSIIGNVRRMIAAKETGKDGKVLELVPYTYGTPKIILYLGLVGTSEIVEP
ncbi:hypothetical protein HDV00_005674 [Rhizophlyctis rosea]|nr:hypothetical protein HDV00_005674 [Rhizophlyctis rosea]